MTTTTAIASVTTPVTPDIAQEIIHQASTVTIFGHSFNVFASILIAMFLMLAYGLYKAQKDKNNPFDWIDMLTGINQSTGKREASSTKIMQLVGGVTGTFIVVKLAILGTLNWDMFAIYLSYVASVDGFTRFMLAKYGVQAPPAPIIAPTPPTLPTTQVTVDVQSMNVKPKDDDN
jgi:hypothetical protein